MVDWGRLDAMTDEEIEAAARSDPDNPPLTEEQLTQMRLIVHRRRKKPTAAE
jgi:putative transcriptional regulator